MTGLRCWGLRTVEVGVSSYSAGLKSTPERVRKTIQNTPRVEKAAKRGRQKGGHGGLPPTKRDEITGSGADQVSLLEHLRVMGDVAGDDVGDGAHRHWAVAGDSASRPGARRADS